MRQIFSEKWIFLALFVFIFSLLLIRVWRIGWSLGSDGLGYYAHIRSAMIDHDLDYANEFRNFNPLGHSVQSPDIKTQTGHVPNKYPIGPALLWIPFFLLAHGVAWLCNVMGYAVPMDGYSLPYQLFIGLGPQIYGLIGLFFVLCTTKRFYPANISLIGLIAVCLGTNVIYYLAVEPTMSHSFSLFTVSLFIFYGISNYKKKTDFQFFLYGLLGGIMTLTRYQNGLFMILPLIEISERLWGSQKKILDLSKYLRTGLIYLSGFLLAILPQLIVWKIIYGDYFVYSYGSEGFDANLKPFYNVLFSTNHGLITWTPLIFFCLVGLAYFIQKYKKFGFFFLSFFLMQYLVNSTWISHSFGSSFSIRTFINCTFIFSLGLSALLYRFKNYLLIFIFIISFFILWNFLLIVQYTLGIIPSTGSYELNSIITNQFHLLRNVLEYLLSNIFTVGEK